MVYGCGNNCVKFLVVFCNLLIGLLGLLLMGFGLWANLDKNFATHLADIAKNADLDADVQDLGSYRAAIWVIVGVGLLLFLVGFLGCCGASCESTVMLSLFFVVIAILAVVELAAVIFALANKDAFKENVLKLMQEGYRKANSPAAFESFEELQKAMKCCGVKDVAHKKKIKCDVPNAPDCFTTLWDSLESAGTVVVVVSFVALIVMLMALIASCILCRAFRERSHGYYA